MIVYNPNRLEWHRDDEIEKTPQVSVWSCQVASVTFVDFNRLAAALAKSQDHRASCGVFAFGQCNAERRWLHLRHPETRASQIREGGRISRAWRLKQVWNSAFAMTWLRIGNHPKHRANFGYDHGKAVLCSNIHHIGIQKKLRNGLLPMPNSSEESQQWSVFVQMRGMLLKAGTENKTGQETSQRHACCNCKISKQSWTGRNIGIRKPELGETPLSVAEMEFAWKKGLV